MALKKPYALIFSRKLSAMKEIIAPVDTIIKKTTDSGALDEAAGILKSGGICAFPTDTVYGLGAVYTDERAVRRIFAAKGRDEKKPLSILIADPSQAKLLSDEIPPEAFKLMKAFWPGALTVIVRKNPSVPDLVSAGKETVGIRMPALKETLDLIRLAGSPLAAPSANISGRRSSVTFEDVYEDLYGKTDMILDGGSCPGGVSSTVVDVSAGKTEILREGEITLKMIAQAIHNS